MDQDNSAQESSKVPTGLADPFWRLRYCPPDEELGESSSAPLRSHLPTKTHGQSSHRESSTSDKDIPIINSTSTVKVTNQFIDIRHHLSPPPPPPTPKLNLDEAALRSCVEFRKHFFKPEMYANDKVSRYFMPNILDFIQAAFDEGSYYPGKEAALKKAEANMKKAQGNTVTPSTSKQVLPQALPQALPQMLPQALPQMLPQVLPQALPQVQEGSQDDEAENDDDDEWETVDEWETDEECKEKDDLEVTETSNVPKDAARKRRSSTPLKPHGTKPSKKRKNISV